MARPLRVEYEGALYHVTSRENARQDIFLDDADRVGFLVVLSQVVEHYGWICHAYCLMTNHYHLLIETPGANFSKGMLQLNGVYTQTFNRCRAKIVMKAVKLLADGRQLSAAENIRGIENKLGRHSHNKALQRTRTSRAAEF